MTTASTSVDLPRHQAGPNPQHLLVTLYGDLWPLTAAALPSAALVALLAEFGVSASSTRSALSRLAQRGVLTRTREGRYTSYALNDSLRQTGLRTIPRILRFGIPPDDDERWQGEWVVVAFSIPDSHRQLRHTLRTKLRWFGFARLQDGIWIAARQFDDELAAMLSEIGEEYVTAFRSTLAFPGDLRSRISLSSLQHVRAGYTDFIAEYAPIVAAARCGDITPAKAFITRETAMDRWRGFYRADPRLPQELLPDEWPLAEASRIFRSVYDELASAAELRYRELLAPFNLADHQAPHHFTTCTIESLIASSHSNGSGAAER